MSKIVRADELPLEDEVFLKKDVFGWRIVQPLKNPEGKIVWVNVLFGGWRNLVMLVCVVSMILLFFAGHEELTREMRLVVESPCGFCNACYVSGDNVVSLPGINISEFLLDGGGTNG